MILSTTSVLSASDIPSNSIDQYNYDVGGGNTGSNVGCHDMKRDVRYYSASFHPVNGSAFVGVRNCENASFADHYSGLARMDLRSSSSGTVVTSYNDYMNPGEYNKIWKTGLSDSSYMTSTVYWDKIDGQDTSGSKVIYASVE